MVEVNLFKGLLVSDLSLLQLRDFKMKAPTAE